MKQKLISIILILIVIFAPLLITPRIGNFNSHFIKVIVLYLGGFLLVVLMLANYKYLKIDKTDTLVLLFMILVFISTCLSSNIKSSILGFETRYEGMLMLFTYTSIYFASKKFLKFNMKKILNLMFYFILPIGILGILQNYCDIPSLFPIFSHGIAGTFGNSNFFGSYISIVLPITITLYILENSKKSFILSNLLFFNLISSGTRSAWVAFVFVAILGLIYLIKTKNIEYWKRAGIIILCFIIILILIFSGLIKTVANAKFNSIKQDINNFSKNGMTNELGSARMHIWKMTLKLIAKQPIFGCGTDNLTVGLIDNCTQDFIEYAEKYESIIDKAHNEYLQIAATIGIPALLVYLSFLGIIILPKIKYFFKEKMMFILLLSIISYLIQAFFNISTIGIAPLFWMLLGYIDNEEIKI